MDANAEVAIGALRNAPGYEHIQEDACTVTRLGGLTNLVHLVDTGSERLIVRVPGEGTEEYIDRKVELVNARSAWKAGVSAEVLWGNADTGVMISRAIDGIETMTPDLFSSRQGSPTRAGRALAKLHRSGQEFEFRFELFAMIEDYLRILSTKDVSLPDGYHDIVRAAAPVKDVLDANPASLTPCHCDPLCENFLDDGSIMWIVDWEYSGMNDPLWDVGDLSVEANMTAEQDTELLQGYFGRAPTAAERGRVVIYKAMCDLLWTLWGLIQHADDNPAEDFWAYATGRFDRCKSLMESAEFADHVAAVGKG